MHDWISALQPPRKPRAPAVAASATLATLLLGWTIPSPPIGVSGWWHAPMAIGLAAVLGVGLIAFLLARATANRFAEPAQTALSPALIAAVLLPQMGAAALAIPAILALIAAWRSADRRPGQRIVALLVRCGAILTVAAVSQTAAGASFACATMLAAALFSGRNPPRRAANDNPQMERAGRDSGVPIFAYYAIGDSYSGSGKYGCVQQ